MRGLAGERHPGRVERLPCVTPSSVPPKPVITYHRFFSDAPSLPVAGTPEGDGALAVLLQEVMARGLAGEWRPGWVERLPCVTPSSALQGRGRW